MQFLNISQKADTISLNAEYCLKPPACSMVGQERSCWGSAHYTGYPAGSWLPCCKGTIPWEITETEQFFKEIAQFRGMLRIEQFRGILRKHSKYVVQYTKKSLHSNKGFWSLVELFVS